MGGYTHKRSLDVEKHDGSSHCGREMSRLRLRRRHALDPLLDHLGRPHPDLINGAIYMQGTHGNPKQIHQLNGRIQTFQNIGQRPDFCGNPIVTSAPAAPEFVLGNPLAAQRMVRNFMSGIDPG